MPNPKTKTVKETEKEPVVVPVPEVVFTRELTTAEKFYIQQHYESIHVDEIAADLGIPVHIVEERVATLNDKDAPKEPTMFERTLAKKKHGTAGAVIMTEGASQHADEHYKEMQKKKPAYVFEPKKRNN